MRTIRISGRYSGGGGGGGVPQGWEGGVCVWVRVRKDCILVGGMVVFAWVRGVVLLSPWVFTPPRGNHGAAICNIMPSWCKCTLSTACPMSQITWSAISWKWVNPSPFQKKTKQECISVGCILPTHWPYTLVLCLPGEGSASRQTPSPQRADPPPPPPESRHLPVGRPSLWTRWNYHFISCL